MQNHALEGTEANSSRVDAAKFLLNKMISNAPTEIDADISHDLIISEVVRKVVS